MLQRVLFSFLVMTSSASLGVKQEQLVGQERSIAERIAGRDFPSVFQAWGRADNLTGEDELTAAARHDLLWSSPEGHGLVWNKGHSGLADAFEPESIEAAIRRRGTLLELNSNIILIAEIRYRAASPRFLPADHEWWRRDKTGKLVEGEGGNVQLDFDNPQFREHVARQAEAVVESGVVDGVMLDWWRDDDSRLALIKLVRQAIGDSFLIITNANDRTTPRTASYINGYFMECYRSKTPKDWQRIAATLMWAEKNLRPPRVNCLETWYHNSRDDLNLMRATTALSLTCSNGYCLFSDPNPLPTPDHLHNWYPFWDMSLGKATSEGVTMSDGSTRREFEKGTVVYNPMGNQTVTVMFDQITTSVATGQTAKSHMLNSLDGDIYLKKDPK